MNVRLAGWKTDAGRAPYIEAYDAAMRLWPVPFESRYVDTRFGSTHVVVSGSPELPPVVLLHAAHGVGATQWYTNAEQLCQHHRLYAVDFVGGAGKGKQTRPILDRKDCSDWLADVIVGLGLNRPAVVGSSQGGWLALNLALLEPERVGLLCLLAPAASIVPFRLVTQLMIRLPMQPAWTGRPLIKALFGGRAAVPDEIVDLLTLHLKHFRYQRRPVIPGVFPEAELRRLESPTLLLVGDHEIIYDPATVLEKAERLIPRIEAELVEGSGHLINMERPKFCSERLLRFLSERRAEVGLPGPIAERSVV
jgi:pimeloyl-ACP methyl ester carboxylesterase